MTCFSSQSRTVARWHLHYQKKNRKWTFCVRMNSGLELAEVSRQKHEGQKKTNAFIMTLKTTNRTMHSLLTIWVILCNFYLLERNMALMQYNNVKIYQCKRAAVCEFMHKMEKGKKMQFFSTEEPKPPSFELLPLPKFLISVKLLIHQNTFLNLLYTWQEKKQVNSLFFLTLPVFNQRNNSYFSQLIARRRHNPELPLKW